MNLGVLYISYDGMLEPLGQSQVRVVCDAPWCDTYSSFETKSLSALVLNKS
jgi:hypothetical protein